MPGCRCCAAGNTSFLCVDTPGFVLIPLLGTSTPAGGVLHGVCLYFQFVFDRYSNGVCPDFQSFLTLRARISHDLIVLPSFFCPATRGWKIAYFKCWIVEFVPVTWQIWSRAPMLMGPREQTPEKCRSRGTFMKKRGFVLLPFLASSGQAVYSPLPRLAFFLTLWSRSDSFVLIQFVSHYFSSVFLTRVACAQSPVAVWANANSFVFSPVNEAPQCQMYLHPKPETLVPKP